MATNYAIEETNCNIGNETRLSVLSDLFDNPVFSDVTFVVEGNEVRCHKAILAASCSYFRAMFSSGLGDPHTIPITTMGYDIFICIIGLIYKGEIKLSSGNAQILLENADMMDYSALKDVISKFYVQVFQPTNCLGFHEMGRKYRAIDLEKGALQYALEYFENVIKSEEFLTCSVKQVQELLHHPEINANSEDEICSSVLKWLEYDPGGRTSDVFDILCGLRLQQLSPYYIQYTLLTHSLVKSNVKVFNMLQQVIFHIQYLRPMPEEVMSLLPRTKTDMITGIAIMSLKRLPGDKRSQFIHYCALKSSKDSEKIILIKKKSTDYCDKSHQVLNSISLDNSIFVSLVGQNSQICRYETATNTFIKTKIVNIVIRNITPVLTENKQIYGVVSETNSHEFQQLLLFEPDYNEWGSFMPFHPDIASEKHKFAVVSHGSHLYILGIGHKCKEGNDTQNCTHIYCIDLSTKKGYILNSQLPQKPNNVKSVVYREHVILVEKDKITTIKLQELQKDADYVKEVDGGGESLLFRDVEESESESGTTNKSEEHKQAQANIASLPINCLPEDSQKFCIAIIGNKLILVTDPDLIRICNADSIISGGMVSWTDQKIKSEILCSGAEFSVSTTTFSRI